MLRLSRRTTFVGLAVLLLFGHLLGCGDGGGGGKAENLSPTAIYSTTYEYMIRFVPAWFFARETATRNVPLGPLTIGPEMGVGYTPNDDTLYSGFALDLTDGPQILTIPETTIIYSIETYPVSGNIFTPDIPEGTPGHYGLVAPDWSGELPPGVARVPVPFTLMTWVFRGDKFSPSGEPQIELAEEFRASVHLASLEKFEEDPSSGRAQIVPLQPVFSARIKSWQDLMVAFSPTLFLEQVQMAVHDPLTSPLVSPSDFELSYRFDKVFDRCQALPPEACTAYMIQGLQDAETAIVNHYLTHTIEGTNWIFFGNAGNTGTAYLDRAAIFEVPGQINEASVATYYNAFVDFRGAWLDGLVEKAYTLRFEADEIPDAKRFWSLTAYLPESQTLVPNAATKYHVASYTPGLHKDPDGSITIYMQPDPPTTVPVANWLPVPPRRFDVILRVYGPTGNSIPGTYAPPEIFPAGRRF